MPTATASHSVRQRCARARLDSPEIHWESPPAVATLPSSDMADLNTTSGRPVRACLRKGWLTRRAAVADLAVHQLDATPSSRRMPSPRPEAFAGRVVGGHHHPADAGLEDGRGARRRAAGVRARLQRDVHGGSGRVLAARGQGHALGVGLAGPGVEALADHGVAADDDGADERVGRRVPTGPLRQLDGSPQVPEITLGGGGGGHSGCGLTRESTLPDALGGPAGSVLACDRSVRTTAVRQRFSGAMVTQTHRARMGQRRPVAALSADGAVPQQRFSGATVLYLPPFTGAPRRHSDTRRAQPEARGVARARPSRWRSA